MIPIQEVSNADVAFPTDVSHLMPKWEDIPPEFKRHKGTKWNVVQSDWFFCGLRNAKWKPLDGVDVTKALRHLQAIQRSYEPQHEHKEAAVAYLMSQWFESVSYEKGRK